MKRQLAWLLAGATVPTGKTRQLQYRLTAGEAGWRLELVNSTEF